LHQLKNFLEEIPYDPYLPQLFSGEELLIAARLFTKGWNTYNPIDSICYHNFSRRVGQPSHWRDDPTWYRDQQNSMKRLKKVLRRPTADPPEDFLKEMDKYGVGHLRTLDEYWKFSKIDWNLKIGNHSAEFCNNYDAWVALCPMLPTDNRMPDLMN